MRALESIFDIGRHILAKSYGFKELELKKIATTLGEKGVVSKAFSTTLVRMAGYRNRIVHLYQEVAAEELYQIIHAHLVDLDRFVTEVGSFLIKYREALLKHEKRRPSRSQ